MVGQSGPALAFSLTSLDIVALEEEVMVGEPSASRKLHLSLRRQQLEQMGAMQLHRTRRALHCAQPLRDFVCDLLDPDMGDTRSPFVHGKYWLPQ